MIEVKFTFNNATEALNAMKLLTGEAESTVSQGQDTPDPKSKQEVPTAPVQEAKVEQKQEAPAQTQETKPEQKQDEKVQQEAQTSEQGMPAPPTFQEPEQKQESSAPFDDAKGMISYVMEAYKELGPERGSQIQAVLGNLGYANINDVKAEDFGKLYSGIEALKG